MKIIKKISFSIFIVSVFFAIGCFDIAKAETIDIGIEADVLSGYAPLTVNFIASVAGANFINYEWDFNDDGVYDFTSPSDPTAIYIYDQSGNFIVVLKLTDDEENIYFAYVEIQVIPDTILPTIILHSPNGINVAVDSNISITFSEMMNTLSAEQAFSISPLIDGSFSWNSDKMIFNPSSNFSYEKNYSVTVSNGAKDFIGNSLQNSYSWNFTTIANSITDDNSEIDNDDNGINDTYPEQTLLKTADSFKIYVIINQKKKWIPTPEVFETLGYEWTSITIIDKNELTLIPDYEDNLIRAINDFKVYLIVNGIKRHIPNPEIFLNYGFEWNEVKDVNLETINQYTQANLIKESKKGEIYYLCPIRKIKRWLRSPEIFNSYNNKWEDIQVISKYEIDSYPTSSLIKLDNDNDNDIYLIEGNNKRLINSAEEFGRLGLDWGRVMGVGGAEFSWFE